MPRVRPTLPSLVAAVVLVLGLLPGAGGLIASATGHGPGSSGSTQPEARPAGDPVAAAEPSGDANPAAATAADVRGARATTEQPDAGPTTVHPSLDTALEGSGAVEAVVTTWTREGLSRVRALGVEGAELRHLPMVLVPALTGEQLAALRDEPAVRSVWPNEAHDLLMEDTTWILGARDAWGDYEADGDGWKLNETGHTGAGIEVAIIDTGADFLHPDFGNLVEFCEAMSVTSTSETVFCSDGEIAEDDNGHGTHVAGTIGGTGEASGGKDELRSTIGIAPDVSIRSYSANAGAFLFTFQILGAYDDLTAKKLNGENDVVAVNNSWGGGGSYDPDEPMQVAFKVAYDAGILSVFAAGNSGPEHDTLSRQCVSPWIVCVGASTKSDAVGMLSSRGRPSEPHDTNRDGTVDDDDVAPDNHDRVLAQELGLPLQRPAIVAPGLEVNAMSANQPTCWTAGENCYEALQGTSMAAPHVTGAAALVAQALGDAALDPETGRMSADLPAIVIDILEASARNLPGYRPEEQGAGRLDVARAVALAQEWPAIPATRFGDPLVETSGDAFLDSLSEEDAARLSSGGEGEPEHVEGCTAPLSQNTSAGIGVHVFDVPEGAERLEIGIEWGGYHPSANLYLQLWRPGTEPGAVIPDNSSMWLLGDLPVPTVDDRWIDVRMPEPGEWTLWVGHRAGGQPLPCRDGSGVGYWYDLSGRIPLVAEDAPEVTSAEMRERDDRFVDLDGTAAFASSDEGLTWWEVPGTEPAPAEGEEGEAEDDRLLLHMKGNLEDGCTGDGRVDVGVCGGPWLVADAELSSAPAARWTATVAVLRTIDPRGQLSPNWLWEPDLADGASVSLAGPMTVEFWATCSACGGIAADWRVRLFVDDQDENTGPHVEERVPATPSTPAVPDRLSVTVAVPPIDVHDRVVVQIEPVFIDVQPITAVLYDSQEPCGPEGPCDSLVRMPVGGTGDTVAPPQDVRVSDAREQGLRLAWEEVDGASSYEIHRSDTPGFTVSEETFLDETTDTTYLDGGVSSGETRYYRVVARSGEAAGVSRLAYGTVQEVLRQVKLKVDRLYAPVAWEYGALDGSSWSFVWDRIGIIGEEHSTPLARVFDEGVASPPVLVTEREEETCPPLPGRGGPPEGRGPGDRCPGPPPGRGPGDRGPRPPSDVTEDTGTLTEESGETVLGTASTLR